VCNLPPGTETVSSLSIPVAQGSPEISQTTRLKGSSENHKYPKGNQTAKWRNNNPHTKMRKFSSNRIARDVDNIFNKELKIWK
jgi:hypothetical protein